MLTVEESIPIVSDEYLRGQDIFWSQFNQVNFYIEDTEQENLYFVILSKIITGIDFEKIFPLNGKQNVVQEALLHSSDKTKIFIVDKDFDDLHNNIEMIDNLFYLDKYCIENYLIEKDALVELVIEECPRKKKDDILNNYSFDEKIREKQQNLSKLFAIFYIVQKYSLGVENSSLPIMRFCEDKNQTILSTVKIEQYKYSVLQSILSKQLTLDLNSEIDNVLTFWEANSLIPNNIGGKHLLYMIVYELNKEFKFSGMPIQDSYCYRLAKNSRFESLNFLRDAIIYYLES